MFPIIFHQRFLQYDLLSNSFLVPRRYTFYLFFLLSLFALCCWLQIIPSICKFLFLWAFWFFSGFGSSILSVMYRFPLYIVSMAYFSLPNSIPMSRLYIFIACISVSIFLFISGKMFNIGVWFFSCLFLSSLEFPGYMIEWNHHHH